MPGWKLVGPKIPARVWRNHLLIARGFESGIVWEKLCSKDLKELQLGSPEPALLVLHGTGLRTRMGTAGFSYADFQALKAQYGSRILAFEHRAVRHGLEKNAQALVRQLEALSVNLRLHVLGLSRGGLLARMLAEGWVRCSPRIQIQKLIFLSTPNEGSLSARWDRTCAKDMKIWRQDVRRLLRKGRGEEAFSLCSEPYALERPASNARGLRAWPLLNGTGDQLPGSSWLKRLNGFAGPPRHAENLSACTYYGLASVFSFQHGAPDRSCESGRSWHDVVHRVFSSTPNDLVVPTAGVYHPRQGPHACGRFPILAHRLLVLASVCNVTHIGMLWHPRVSAQVVSWLAETPSAA